MLTNFEKAALKEFGNKYAEKVVHAIKTKKVDRYTDHKGNFSAVVNASGRLANSVTVKVNNDFVGVYALEYINNLIYGKPPGKRPSVSDIARWQQAKGVGGSAYAIARNIGAKGNSIYQRWKGQNSGLLDFDYEQDYNKMALTILKGYGSLVSVNVKELLNDYK